MKNKNQILYVKEFDISLTKTRKAFLEQFIKNGGYDTFSDPECKKLQCSKRSENGSNNSYRSITELNAILRSRFKITSLEGTVRLIKQLIDQDADITIVWCKMIKKCVVKYQKNTPKTYITDYSKSNYYKTKGVDGYSLEDFDNMYKSL